MMARRLTWLVLVMIILATGVQAQVQPVALRYKFTPGRTDTMDIRATGLMPLTVNLPAEVGGQALNLDISLDMTMTMNQAHQASLPDGSGIVALTFTTMVARTGIPVADQPMDAVVTWQDGKLTSTVNGQAQPVDENLRKQAEALGSTLLMTVKPTGETTPQPETLAQMKNLFGSTGFGGVDMSRLSALTSRLPDKPVSPGDSWETKDEVNDPQLNVSGASRMVYKGMEECNGVQAARIEGTASFSMSGQMAGAGSAMGMQYNITRLEANINFVNHFDPQRGVMIQSELALCQNINMMLTVAGMAPQPMHVPLAIERGQMTLLVKTQ